MSAAPRPGVCATAAEAAREIRRAIGPALGEGFADHTGWTAAPAGGPDDAIFWREVPGAAAGRGIPSSIAHEQRTTPI